MKQTEIGLIPDDWEVIKILGNYFLKGRIGWQGLKASEFKDQGPYLVTGTDFVNGRVNWNTCYHISEKRYEEDKALHVREDDILITKDGTIGKVAYVDKKPEKVSLNSHLLIIRPLKDKLLNRYLYYILNSKFFYDYYQQTQTGTTMASLSQDKISKFVYPLPSKEEQQRIAKALSDVDALISTTEKLIQKKQNIKQGTMQNLLTGKKRLPGFGLQTKSPTYKQTELGPIPEDWKVMSLGEIGYFIGGGTPDTNKTEYWKGSIPWISSSDISKNNIKDVFPTRFITKSAIENSATKICPKNTILIVSRVGVGKLAISKNEVCTSQDFSNFICEQQNVEFVAYQLLPMMQNKSSDAQGTSIKGITSDEIQNMKITLPSKEEQTAIANVLSSMDKEIETLNTKLEKYRNLKTAMMQQLLTGKIRLVK